MAQTYVYPGFTEHVLPTDTYKQKAIPVLEARMVYGAERLAALIEDIYGNSTLFDATQ